MLDYSFNALSCQHLIEKNNLRHFYDNIILDPSIVQSKIENYYYYFIFII
jgi:hypothetical protein